MPWKISMIVLDEFEFLVKDNELAIAIDCPTKEIKSLIWDYKNVIILNFIDNNKYALINILPNIREILEKVATVLIIFKQNDEVVDAFDVELIKDNSLNFDDLFEEGAISCYKKLEELKEANKNK